jgi:hypothetical protein
MARRPTLTGRFKPSLTSHEAMRGALADLLGDADHYFIFIRQPRNYQAGTQANTLTLYDDDPLDLTTSLDPQLLRSRSVKVVIASKTWGAAQVNVTARRWEILQDSPAVRAKLADFGAALKAGKRSRLISPGYMVFALTFPLWAVAVIAVAWAFGNPENRALFTNPKTPANAPLAVPYPHWTVDLGIAFIASWPFWLFVGFMIGATYYLAGGLLVWPEVMTFASAARAIHNVRASLFTLPNFNALVIAVLAGIICVLFGLVLAHV